MLRGVLLTAATASAAGSIFTVTDDSYSTGKDTVKLKVLRNTRTGEWASVIPQAGGAVDELHLLPPGKTSPVPVLWGHSRNATEVVHNPTWKGRILLPYANRIGGAKCKKHTTFVEIHCDAHEYILARFQRF